LLLRSKKEQKKSLYIYPVMIIKFPKKIVTGKKIWAKFRIADNVLIGKK